MDNVLTGKVIEVLSAIDLVINKGSCDGVEKSNRFLIYRLGEEMFDPDTGQSLGILELICGEGKPVHIQEHITTLRSCKTENKNRKKVITRNSGSIYTGFGTTEEIESNPVVIPFEDVEAGCLFKQLR